jgi:hypothetical protein
MLGISVMALSGLVVTTNISYALGAQAAWMQESKWIVSIVSCILTISLVAVSIRGLSLGKWVHNAGGIIMIVTYGALIVLPFLSLARGELKEYHPLTLVVPTMSILGLNILTKMAVGGMSGFEYVAILAGECKSPARNVGLSVLVAAPIIVLMFILEPVRFWPSSRRQIDLIDRHTDVEHRLSILAYGHFVGVGGHPAAGGTGDRRDEHVPSGQFSSSHGGRLGPPSSGMVYAFARPLSHPGQLHSVCGSNHVSLLFCQPDWGGRAGGISSGR